MRSPHSSLVSTALIYIVAENLARESYVFRLKHVAREQTCFNSRPVPQPVATESMLSLRNFTETLGTLAWQESAIVGEALLAGVPTRR